MIVIHTTHWPPPAPLFEDLDLLSRLGVPAFMLLTGVLLSYQYGDRPIRPGSFLRRRFSRSLLPWLFWAPVYAATGWLITGDVGHSAGGLGTFFSYGAGHLWFLLLIPQMYLLFLVWPRRRLWLWAGVAVVVQLALSVYRLYGAMPNQTVEQLTLWHGFQLLPFWVGYFAVGLAAGATLARRGPPQGAAAGTIALLIAATVGSGWLLVALSFGGAAHRDFQQGTGGFLLPQEPLFVFSTAALVLVAGPPLVARSRSLFRVSRVLSENSLGVYIVHPILIYAIGRQIGGLLAPGLPLSFLGFLVLTIAGLVAAVLVSLLIAATPLAPTLGARRRSLGGPWRRQTQPSGAGS